MHTVIRHFPWSARIFLRLVFVTKLGWQQKYHGICYTTEFVKKYGCADLLDGSTTWKETINLNLYKHLKNPFLLILSLITFMFSVLVKLLVYLSVAKLLIQCPQEWLKRIITSIFVIRKFDFQISVQICKAKF